MEDLLQRFFFLVVGLFYAGLSLFRTLILLILRGPNKIFELKDRANPPQQLFDSMYGEHSYVNVGPITLHYVSSGPTDAPLMLMLHGFPEIWYSWRYQIKEFQKDFRVVAVDMRGFGGSDKPAKKEKYRMELLVEDVRALIDALGYKSCILVGHDWGAAVAYAFAAHYTKMVDRLVVMNMAPAALWWSGFTSWSRPKQFLASGYIYLFHMPYLPEVLLRLEDVRFLDTAFLSKRLGVQSGLMTQNDVECYKYYFRKPGAMKAGINYYRANLYVPPTFPHTLDYPMPVRIIWGVMDIPVGLDLLEDTLKAIPHASVTRIQDASHWVQMDRPEAVNNSIREFLDSTRFGVDEK